MKMTFAEYLVKQIVPEDIKVDKPITKKELERILLEVRDKHPDKFGYIVSDLKKLGDKFAVNEGITIGPNEISVPNKKERDKLIKKYSKLYTTATTESGKASALEKLQDKIVANDTSGMSDSASLMIESGGLGSKRNQLVKMRSTPAVVKDHEGNLVPEIITKAYSEGLDITHHWLQSAEARANLVQGQVSTSKPGEFNKVLNNLVGDVVVSMEDCHTKNGILLNTADEDVIDRYLAVSAGTVKRDTLITPEVQQKLLKQGKKTIVVRSPQTCDAPDHTVCSKCMGLSIDNGKPMPIGYNAGAITAGSLSEPLVQLTLSAKHSTTLAKREEGLRGEKGFRTFVEMPKQYPNRKILSEVYGEVVKILPAPQGGKFLDIRQTRPVPDRYIVLAEEHPLLKKHWRYYIPPQRHLLKNVKVKTKVYPGMELTDGVDNLKDIARLRSLGAARSAAAQGVRDIYANTGQHLDRRHFELLGRSMMTYVKLEKVPRNFPFMRGEVVNYNKLKSELTKLPYKRVALKDALGMTLMENINDVTIGSDITPVIIDHLKKNGVKTVKVTEDLELSPVTTPLTRVLNNSDEWLSKLNHRFIKQTLKDAAQYGQKETIHGYRPIAAYAYGAEITQDKEGKY